MDVRFIRILVLRLAQEPGMRIPAHPRRTRHFGIKIAASTVWEILKTAGIDPAPQRSTVTQADFLRSQAQAS